MPIDRVVEVEKIFEKEKLVEVEKIVEVPVDRVVEVVRRLLVEVPVYIDMVEVVETPAIEPNV